MYAYWMTQRERPSKVLGYIRVSTEEQGASGLGLADQRAVLEVEAARRGWDLEVLADEGYSAKSLNRPAIALALAALAAGEAGTLVVAKLDRLSRSLLDFATLMDTARRQRWELVVLDLALDTTTPAGQLMANVMASFAEYERALIGHRTAAALAQLKSQGVRLGRPRETPDAVVARVLRERQEGHSLRAIAQGLADDGIPTSRGGQWHASTVQALLRSAELDAAAHAAAL